MFLNCSYKFDCWILPFLFNMIIIPSFFLIDVLRVVCTIVAAYCKENIKRRRPKSQKQQKPRNQENKSHNSQESQSHKSHKSQEPENNIWLSLKNRISMAILKFEILGSSSFSPFFTWQCVKTLYPW